ncbi:kinase-like domain-containing protein [Collybia nuda]|uniref:Kinase-like domain-containing protein n=1 Tax=Collybia nuda TaxID=64659 RepID=A0A9P6CD56_9AGAR|nr:kinase-like domain-containing protein [Collybia nuda]
MQHDEVVDGCEVRPHVIGLTFARLPFRVQWITLQSLIRILYPWHGFPRSNFVRLALVKALRIFGRIIEPLLRLRCLVLHPSRHDGSSLGQTSVFRAPTSLRDAAISIPPTHQPWIPASIQGRLGFGLIIWVRAVANCVLAVIRRRLWHSHAQHSEVQRSITASPTPPRDLTSEIERVNGSYGAGGGFAVVYNALWRRDGQIIKVGVKAIRIPRECGGRGLEIAKKRSQREVLVWSHLHHPNILRLLGIAHGFGAQGTYSMVCPWIDNGDLSHYLKCHTMIGPSERLNMLRQIADALYYLHSNSVVHGDLTGNNILVANDGSMLLCDFGLSSINEDYSDGIYDTSSMPKYNLPWTAPEIVLPDFPPRPSQNTDIYSFGSVTYQVLTGVRPYHGMAEGPIYLLLRDRGFPHYPQDGSIPNHLWQFMLRCWDWNPDERLRVVDIRIFLSSTFI